MGISHFSLLRILADGSLHSGEQLGRSLGLSSVGLRTLVRRVEALGLRVLKVRGRGYRLAESLDLLERSTVAGRLARSNPEMRIEFVDECPSTNTVLAERAARRAPHGLVLVCEQQSAGRGRRGNRWISVIGGSLAFSILWRFSGGSRLAGLSLAVAVGVAQALERLGLGGVRVKWPNDLYCEGGKVGGILIEVSGDISGPSAAVIGVGINVRLGGAARERIGQPVSDLARCGGVAPSRSLLLAALLEGLALVLAQFAREGFEPFREEWLRRHAWQDRQVALELAGRQIAEGRIVGIAEDGALMLASPGGVQRFHSGELSLRQR
jgi:BirA family biotin operon repressor/biotin-[acetyl-CoA-carboxylase] ligase